MSLASKWSTLRSLIERGDWSGIRERVVRNSLNVFGNWDPGNPKSFAAWQAAHPPRDTATLLALLGDDVPLVSVLTPVYNVKAELLHAAIDSVRAQIYPNWQLVLVNDGSTAPHIRPLLDAIDDPRITVVHHEKNQGIGGASQTAVQHARGEWVALLDNDDELTPDALAEMIVALRGAQWGYSDFVLKRPDGALVNPYFKPDWSPERLMSQMYLNHLQVMKRQHVSFRAGFDGSQDFELALRMSEKVTPVHVPKVLYHWRITPGSTSERYDAKPYADDGAKRALRTALVRRGYADALDGGDGRNACTAHVESGRAAGTFVVDYRVPKNGLVSIIIPFRDAWAMTERCLMSIVARSRYKNYEIILVDNGSKEEVTREGIEAFCHAHRNVRCLRDDSPFNHSALNNFGARHASGEVLVLLNNDIEIESEDWIERLLVFAERPEIGAVGCLLLYPNRTIQHAGLILGVRGVAGTAFKRSRETHPGYFGSVAAVQNVSAVTGACLMVKKALYDELGGLDADALPTSYNDVDFCLRLRLRGLRNVYTGHATLLHYESYTRKIDPREDEYKRVMQLRWGPLLHHDPYFSPNLSLEREDYRF
jgi:glycosyltransferase involved in cell wall biosynthesis